MKDIIETNKKLFSKYLDVLEQAFISGKRGIKRYLKWMIEDFDTCDEDNLYYTKEGIISMKHCVKANEIWQKILMNYTKHRKDEINDWDAENYLKGLAKDEWNKRYPDEKVDEDDIEA